MRAAIACILVTGLAWTLPGVAQTCETTVQHPLLSQLDRVHVADDRTRIFYTLEGIHGIANVADQNGNAIPDVIEDAATQVRATYHLTQTLLQLRLPWEQIRYRSHVSGIDIHFRAFESSHSGRGAAYDVPMKYSRQASGAADACTLRIDITNHWGKHNQTLPHEVFHQIQYGYAMFKNPWYLEGLAAWSEDLLGVRAPPEQPLPQSTAAIQTLLSSSYAAQAFWSRLGYVIDCLSAGCSGTGVAIEERESLNYVDGSDVLEDSRFWGKNLIRSLLVALDALDQTLLPGHQWSAAEKTDTSHNSKMLDVVRNLYIVRLRSTHDHPLAEELRGFLAAAISP